MDISQAKNNLSLSERLHNLFSGKHLEDQSLTNQLARRNALVGEVEQLESQLSERDKQIEKMKCCSNCAHEDDTDLSLHCDCCLITGYKPVSWQMKQE